MSEEVMNAPVAPATAETTSPEAQKSQPTWRENLSDDYRGKYEEIKDVDSLMKGYDSLVKKMGKNPIVKPGEDADEAAKAEYRKTLQKELGYSENRSDYKVNFSDIPDYLDSHVSEEALGPYVDLALDLGLAPDQFQGFVGKYIETQMADMEKMREETIGGLKEEWGGDYDARIKSATEFAKQVAPELLENPVLGNHPDVIRMIDKLAKQFGNKIGEGPVQVAGGHSGNVNSLESKRQELLKRSLDATLSAEERSNAVREASDVYRKLQQIKG